MGRHCVGLGLRATRKLSRCHAPLSGRRLAPQQLAILQALSHGVCVQHSWRWPDSTHLACTIRESIASRQQKSQNRIAATWLRRAVPVAAARACRPSVRWSAHGRESAGHAFFIYLIPTNTADSRQPRRHPSLKTSFKALKLASFNSLETQPRRTHRRKVLACVKRCCTGSPTHGFAFDAA